MVDSISCVFTAHFGEQNRVRPLNVAKLVAGKQGIVASQNECDTEIPRGQCTCKTDLMINEVRFIKD